MCDISDRPVSELIHIFVEPFNDLAFREAEIHYFDDYHIIRIFGEKFD
jgi:hypothetical protein